MVRGWRVAWTRGELGELQHPRCTTYHTVHVSELGLIPTEFNVLVWCFNEFVRATIDILCHAKKKARQQYLNMIWIYTQSKNVLTLGVYMVLWKKKQGGYLNEQRNYMLQVCEIIETAIRIINNECIADSPREFVRVWGCDRGRYVPASTTPHSVCYHVLSR